MEHEADDRPTGDVDEIRLTLPALASYARVVRLAITGLASRNGFSYEEVEDLRIAAGEVFGVVVEPESANDRLIFTTRLGPDSIELDACRPVPGTIGAVSDLTRQILAAVVDEAVIDTERGCVHITKRWKGR